MLLRLEPNIDARLRGFKCILYTIQLLPAKPKPGTAAFVMNGCVTVCASKPDDLRTTTRLSHFGHGFKILPPLHKGVLGCAGSVQTHRHFENFFVFGETYLFIGGKNDGRSEEHTSE